MYHSIYFGDKNTWDDWHLIPSSRPVFSTPKVKSKYLDIPGGNGSIDLTDALTGYPLYNNREGSFEFLVMNDYGHWFDRYSDIADYIHGQSMRIILEDEPEYYYEGRCAMGEWRSEKDWSRVVIEYNVGPYKWSLANSIDDWLWNPFSFKTGVIRKAIFDGIEIPTSAAGALTFLPVATGTAPVSPSFISTVAATLTIVPSSGSSVTRALPADQGMVVPGLILYNGKWLWKGHQATVSIQSQDPDGTLTLLFRPGRL